MSDVAIRVENLSKLYHIGHTQERHDTLRDALVSTVRAPLERLRRRTNHESRITNHEDTIWALRDVSFEVQRGEVVGVIGRNGAGKSTLLKILSRITEPTAGRAEIHGRVGSLLEVGTGFHPELTGRENVYLSGAILGMRRVEIGCKFDEIVAFAEIEKFLDTPVKRYSSGMYVRLAFAVAAHLDPEILLVDEVLAVGDAAFQKKCLGKMGDVAKCGRTVLFVSHNMASIQLLCTRALYISAGELTFDSLPVRAIEKYYGEGGQSGEIILNDNIPRAGSGDARFVRVSLLDTVGRIARSIRMGEGLILRLELQAGRRIIQPVYGVRISDARRQHLIRLISDETFGQMPSVVDHVEVELKILNLDLMPGTYYVTVGVRDGNELLDHIEDQICFEVIPASIYPTGKNPPQGSSLFFARCDWKVR